MDKIQLIVLGLSASPASNNAYALIMKEADGDRRLPIIIGAFEAQAIALEMEGVMPPRPMTHDLMKNLLDQFGTTLTEIYINDLNDGTFYAKLIFDDGTVEVDARPSDAVALAVRYNAPIYVNSNILEESGLAPQGEEGSMPHEGAEPPVGGEHLDEPTQPKRPRTKVEQLQIDLDKAIKNEDYEKAAELRDELKRILESS